MGDPWGARGLSRPRTSKRPGSAFGLPVGPKRCAPNSLVLFPSGRMAPSSREWCTSVCAPRASLFPRLDDHSFILFGVAVSRAVIPRVGSRLPERDQRGRCFGPSF